MLEGCPCSFIPVLAMISMMIIPISMESMVPSGPATGRNVVPCMAKTPQPTI